MLHKVKRYVRWEETINKTFKRWKVLSYVGRDKDGGAIVLCRCSCGMNKNVRVASLISGKSTSCGCLQQEIARSTSTKHGKSRTRTYRIWQHILDRCCNKNNTGFKYYGGRGITVCEQWTNFENFFNDMGECPPNKSIDRINNDDGYKKDNCRWATQVEQNRNTRQNVYLAHLGKTKTVAEWAKALNMRHDVLSWRLNHGWSIEKTLSTPIKNRKVDK